MLLHYLQTIIMLIIKHLNVAYNYLLEWNCNANLSVIIINKFCNDD